MTFKNTKFTKRDYESTNIVFCVSEKAPDENWKECDAQETSELKCVPLFKQDGAQFFGWM